MSVNPTRSKTQTEILSSLDQLADSSPKIADPFRYRETEKQRTTIWAIFSTIFGAAAGWFYMQPNRYTAYYNQLTTYILNNKIVTPILNSKTTAHVLNNKIAAYILNNKAATLIAITVIGCALTVLHYSAWSKHARDCTNLINLLGEVTQDMNDAWLSKSTVLVKIFEDTKDNIKSKHQSYVNELSKEYDANFSPIKGVKISDQQELIWQEARRPMFKKLDAFEKKFRESVIKSYPADLQSSLIKFNEAQYRFRYGRLPPQNLESDSYYMCNPTAYVNNLGNYIKLEEVNNVFFAKTWPPEARFTL